MDNSVSYKKNNFLNHRINISTNKKLFGFWLYLMSDCILFATMFAIYCVLSSNTIVYSIFFNLKFVFFETLILLLSSVSFGISTIFINLSKMFFFYLFFLITFFLGLFFVLMELYEFNHLIYLGFYPQNNSFLSSFFTLISMHAIHVIVGLIWMLIIFFQTILFNLDKNIYVRILCLGLFWHFLDIIWIFVFTIVYLIGSL